MAEPETKPPPITAYVLICDRVLNEGDSILSAIRISDHFTSNAPPEAPGDDIVINLQVLSAAKFALEDQHGHSLQLQLIRPNGESKLLHEPSEVALAPKVAGFPRGLQMISVIGIKLTQPGLHFFALMCDGVECCRTPFMLRRQTTESKEPKG